MQQQHAKFDCCDGPDSLELKLAHDADETR